MNVLHLKVEGEQTYSEELPPGNKVLKKEIHRTSKHECQENHLAMNFNSIRLIFRNR